MVPAALCVACQKLHVHGDLLQSRGSTLCCRPCQDELFTTCDACQETIENEPIQLPCSHAYCKECLAHCFQAGLTSIADFPPKCCGHELCIHQYKPLLPAETIRKYLELLSEKVLSKDIICDSLACVRQAIKSDYIKDDWGLCPKCLDYTCTRCQQLQSKHKATENLNPNHEAATVQPGSKQESGAELRICPSNEDAELQKLAKDQHWRACPHCHAVVSRIEGCNDMRCRCGKKFCYTCGATYKNSRTCSCPMTFEPRWVRTPDAFQEIVVIDDYEPELPRRRYPWLDPEQAGMIDPDIAERMRRHIPDARGYRAGIAWPLGREQPSPIIRNHNGVANAFESRPTGQSISGWLPQELDAWF